MKKIVLKILAYLASQIISFAVEELKKRNNEVYKVVAENFCDVLLEEMARDVAKRDAQLEESVNRIRNNNENAS